MEDQNINQQQGIVSEVGINLITVGERHRKEMGNIHALSDSIGRLGLLQPIGVDDEYNLVFGYRRLLACKALGHKTIQVKFVRVFSRLQAMNDENEIRKDFEFDERVSIGMAVKEEWHSRLVNGACLQCSDKYKKI